MSNYNPNLPHRHGVTEADSQEMLQILIKNKINGLDQNGGTDKIIAHSFTGIYEKWMKPIRYNKNNMLEIGVYTGGSAILWHDYLNNTEIDMLDINDSRSELSKSLDRANFYLKDGYTEETINFLKEKRPEGYDIIIDDGPHTLDSQIYALVNYLELLKTDGIFFIEDIQDISWCNILFASIPNNVKKNLEINFYDLREYKNRWDDLFLVIKKIK